MLTKNVIDGHTHIYDWYSADGTDYMTLLDGIQAETGLKALSVAALTDRIYGGADINIMAAIYKLHNPTAYAHADLFLPEYPARPPFADGLDSLTQYNELRQIGFDGFKLLYKPDVQKLIQMRIDDPYYEPFFAAAERDHVNIVWHVADPAFCWDPSYTGAWSYRDGTYPGADEMYRDTFAVLERHPKLNVTFAHFFFWSHQPEKLATLFEQYPNVHVDVTPNPGMYDDFTARPDFYRDFFSTYRDRILFGTDSEVPVNPHCAPRIEQICNALITGDEIRLDRHLIRGLNLPDAVSDCVLYRNFRRACGETPRPINPSALSAYIEKYRGYITKKTNLDPILTFAQAL